MMTSMTLYLMNIEALLILLRILHLVLHAMMAVTGMSVTNAFSRLQTHPTLNATLRDLVFPNLDGEVDDSEE
jgi:hypothetical protein